MPGYIVANVFGQWVILGYDKATETYYSHSSYNDGRAAQKVAALLNKEN